MILTIENDTHCSGRPKEQERHAVAISADDDCEGWATIILTIVVELLALWIFLAMGSLFALVGPWMILAVHHLVRQKWVRKAGRHLRQKARKFVASIRFYATTWKGLPRDRLPRFT